MNISVQQEDFDLTHEYQRLRACSQNNGAIVTFTGLVRELSHHNKLSSMFIEHYPIMTEAALSKICEQAKTRWEVDGIRVIHRVGELLPNDQIVFVGISSKHREAAFAAAEFIMDFLKTKAPFWKQERTLSGDVWLSPNHKDTLALSRWQET